MKAQINMLMLCTIASFCKAQCTINCTDNIGRRQGHWIDNTPKSLDVINATSRYANYVNDTLYGLSTTFEVLSLDTTLQQCKFQTKEVSLHNKQDAHYPYYTEYYKNIKNDCDKWLLTKTHFKIAEKDELYISYYDNHQIKQLKRNYADTLEETVNYSKKGVVEYFENRYKRAKFDKSFLSDSTVIYDSNYTVRSVDVHNMTKWIRFNYDKKSKLIQVIDFVKLSRLPPDRILFEGSMRKMGKNQQAWFIRDSLKGDTYLDEKVKFIWVYPFGVCKSITRLN